MKELKDKRIWWIGIGFITFLIHQLLQANPYFTEVAYTRGLFNLFRQVYDFTLGWIPIPVVYLLFFALVSLLLFWIVQSIQKGIRPRKAVFGIIAFISMVYSLFYWLWGFNYSRRSVEAELNFSKAPVDSSAVISMFEKTTADLLSSRQALTSDTLAISKTSIPEDLEEKLRILLETQLQENGNYPIGGRVRVRELHPEGLLMQLGATGIYIPFVAEGHVDAALSAASLPFTMAHEMAHGYGFADEGTCNFWAFLACTHSKQDLIVYSGQLGLWRYLAGSVKRLNPPLFQETLNKLPPGIKNDLREIRRVRELYPGFFPKTSEKIYDRYLRNQGIQEGTVNYSRVIQLVYRWQMTRKAS